MKFRSLKRNIACIVMGIIIAGVIYLKIEENFKYFYIIFFIMSGISFTDSFTYIQEKKTIRFGIFNFKRCVHFEQIKYLEQVYRTKEDLNYNNQKKCDTYMYFDDNKVHKIDKNCINVLHGSLIDFLKNEVKVPVSKVVMREK